MKKVLAAAVAAAIVGLVSAPASAQYGRAGTLLCSVAGGAGYVVGSQKAVDCEFRPLAGPAEHYVGTLSKFGVDIGITQGSEIAWQVQMSTSNPRRGALAGTYVGATGEATVIGGVGANVLVGGSNRTVSLQPLSVQGQLGLNVAGGIGELRLQEVRPVRKHRKHRHHRRHR